MPRPPPSPPAAKAERLKQAKEEAEREIATYKAEREAEFKRKVAEVSTRLQSPAAPAAQAAPPGSGAAQLRCGCRAGACCRHAVRGAPADPAHRWPPDACPQDSSASTENVKQLTAESEGAIKAIQESIRHKEKEVLNLLLGEVTTVKLGANGKK